VTVLATVLVVLVVLAALTSVAALIVLRRLHRPLELVPGKHGPVPLGWRWSLSRAAILQRRLVLALAGARLAASNGLPDGTVGAPWADLVGDAERLAVAVEARLVVAARQPRALRQRLLAELEPEIVQVEQVTARLASTIGTWAAGTPDVSAAQLIERLDAVDAALADVARADTTAELGPVPASELPVGGHGVGHGRAPAAQRAAGHDPEDKDAPRRQVH
jgi:hypothetical protein